MIEEYMKRVEKAYKSFKFIHPELEPFDMIIYAKDLEKYSVGQYVIPKDDVETFYGVPLATSWNKVFINNPKFVTE